MYHLFLIFVVVFGLWGAVTLVPVAAQEPASQRIKSARPSHRALTQARAARRTRGRPRVRHVLQDTLPHPGRPLLDFQIGHGEINVKVADIMADTTIRLGLAPGGVTLVEFPADDYVFAYYPGDENFVTLDAGLVKRQRPTDPLVFRPGVGFFVPAPGQNLKLPYGQLTVQMVSGVVFTFHIYPVRELTRSTTRVALSYQVAEVVAARTRAGLPANLHLREMDRQADVGARPTPEPAADSPQPAVNAARELPRAPPVPFPLTPEKEAQALAENHLPSAGPERKFAMTRHGLALAAQPTRLLPDNWHLDFITVKNTLRQPLRLVNLPELFIETREKSSVVNRESYPIAGVAHNLPADGLLQPGQSYTFALVTRPPMLGAKQFLAVAVAQTNAADEPTVLALLERAR